MTLICAWCMRVSTSLPFPSLISSMISVCSCSGLIVRIDFLTASWAISVYYAFQRTWKPFNPILGETYEMANYNGVNFISEQVRELK